MRNLPGRSCSHEILMMIRSEKPPIGRQTGSEVESFCRLSVHDWPDRRISDMFPFENQGHGAPIHDGTRRLGAGLVGNGRIRLSHT